SDVEEGIEMNLDFFLGILNALNVGDVLNEAAYAVRPFETRGGQTDEVLGHAFETLHKRFRERPRCAGYLATFWRQLTDGHLRHSVEDAARAWDQVEIDRLRVKPIVKITGEFWAQTTEGDGNFRMFQFLEREGAQVLVEPIATWITYMLHQVVQKHRD